MRHATVGPTKAGGTRLHLAAIGLLLALAAACTESESRAAERRPAAAPARDTAFLGASALALAGFDTGRADSAGWRETWPAPARVTLDPTSTQVLGAIAEGRVTHVYVQPGDRVRRGQVLVAVHSHEMMDARASLTKARIGLAQAEDALRLARAGADRAERLHEERALSVADLERARGERHAAESARDQARAELSRAEDVLEHLHGGGLTPPDVDTHDVLIRSPIDGTVISRQAQTGVVVLVGAPLVTVSRLSGLLLRIPVPERALPAARVGAPLTFTVGALPGRTFSATITRVAPAVDSLTRTVETLADVRDPAGLLKAEMFATATLQGDAGARTLSVPAEAIQELEGDTVVVAVTRRGDGLLLEAVPVRVGRRGAQEVEIVAGLRPGTTLVTRHAAVAKAELLKRRGAVE